MADEDADSAFSGGLVAVNRGNRGLDGVSNVLPSRLRLDVGSLTDLLGEVLTRIVNHPIRRDDDCDELCPHATHGRQVLERLLQTEPTLLLRQVVRHTVPL